MLVESEALSEAEVNSWIQDYSFSNPLGKRFREQIRRANFDTEGVIAVSEPRLPNEQLFARPAGQVKRISIKDEK